MEQQGTETSKFDHWIDRALWAVLCAVFIYASQQISDLSKNVVELRIALSANTLAVASAKTELDDHEIRIRALEGVSRKRK